MGGHLNNALDDLYLSLLTAFFSFFFWLSSTRREDWLLAVCFDSFYAVAQTCHRTSN
jgi:hypothetical protein